MTLTEIMERVCLQAGLAIPNSYVGSTNRTVMELLTHAQEAGEELNRRAEWSKTYKDLTVSASASSVAIPNDFHRLIESAPVTENGADFSPVYPVQSSGAWRFIEMNPSAQRYYFISGGTMYFSPAFGADGGLVRYIRKTWIDSSGSYVAKFAADDNSPVFSGELMALGTLWRYKRAKGLPHEDILAEYEAEFARELLADRGVLR